MAELTVSLDEIQDINPNRILSLRQVAFQDDRGNWHLGGDYARLTDQKPGQFISSELADSLRTRRKSIHLVKSIMRAKEVSVEEAHRLANEMLDELEGVEDEEERKEIWRKYGSP